MLELQSGEFYCPYCGEGPVPNVPTFDLETAAKMRTMVIGLKVLQVQLNTRKPGCSCDTEHLCAHHSQTSHDIDNIIEDTEALIRHITKES